MPNTLANPVLTMEAGSGIKEQDLLQNWFNRIVDEEWQTAKCEPCQTERDKPNHNGICPQDGAGPHCEFHANAHQIDRHPQDWLRHLAEVTRKFQLKNGHFLTFLAHEKGAIGTFNDPFKPEARNLPAQKSACFQLGHLLNLPFTIVTKWRYADDHETDRQLADTVRQFCRITGLSVIQGLETNGSSGILLPMAPAHSLLNRDTRAETGFHIRPDCIAANKIAKRLMILAFGDITGVVPTPSFAHNDHPAIRLPNGDRITLRIKDTRRINRNHFLKRGSGDGAGAIRLSAALRLLRAFDAAKGFRKLQSLQVNIALADAFLKGVWRIIPDHRFPSTDPNLDLIIDADSVSNQVTNTKFTILRILRKNFKPQPGFIAVEPLLQADWIEQLLDTQEMAEVQARLMPQLHQQDRQAAWQRRNRQEAARAKKTRYLTRLQPDADEEAQPQWNDTFADLLLSEALSTAFAKGMLDIALQESGPYANGPAYSREGGRIPNKMNGKRQRNHPLTPIYLSGAHATLTDPTYNGETYPKPGFIRIIRDETTGHIAEFGLAPIDTERLEAALDTSDCDDAFTLAFVTTPDGKPGCLIMKLPMSVQGGALLKVNQLDAKALKAEGYHFYRLQPGVIPEDGICAAIHQTGQNGQPLTPDRLIAPQLPADQLPKRPEPGEDPVLRLSKNRRFRREVGQATNLMQAIYISGLWDLSIKMGMSEQIVDPVENGDRNPTAMVEALTDFLYQKVVEGHPIDSCIAGRVSRLLRERHAQVQGPHANGLTIRENCRHDQRRSSLDRVLQEENRKLRRREAAANGPIDQWLDRAIPDELTKIVAQAMTKRDEAWSKCQSSIREFAQETEHWIDRHGIERQRTHSRQERKIHEAIQKREARAAEARAMAQAWQQAGNLESHRPGSIHHLWNLLWLYRKNGKTVSVYSLAKLPDTEHRAFYGKGISRPIIALKAHQQHRDAADQLIPGYLVQLKGNKQSNQFHYWLRSAETKDNLLRVAITDEVKAIAPQGSHCTMEVVRVLKDPEGKDDKGRLILLDLTPNLPNG